MLGRRARTNCTVVGSRLPAREMILRSKKRVASVPVLGRRAGEWGGKGGVLGPVALFMPSFGCYGTL
jgi:hypothetical protein